MNTSFADLTDEEKEITHKRYFSQHIMRLSSGRFALMTSFSNAIGIKPQAIGTLEELEPLIVVPEPGQYRDRILAAQIPNSRFSSLDVEITL